MDLLYLWDKIDAHSWIFDGVLLHQETNETVGGHWCTASDVNRSTMWLKSAVCARSINDLNKEETQHQTRGVFKLQGIQYFRCVIKVVFKVEKVIFFCVDG